MRSLSFVSLLSIMLSLPAISQKTPSATLTASDTSSGGQLGKFVVMSGSTVAATGAARTNSVIYVFTKSSNESWTDMNESARLQGMNGGPAGGFMAMSGDGGIIVGSAPGGGLYVFAKPTEGWKGTLSPIAKLIQAAPEKPWIVPGDLNSVAINSKGDTIVAGAYDAGTQNHMSGGKLVTGNTQQGAVYVWTEPVGGWTNANGQAQTAKLTATDGKAYDQFGWSVGISANTVVAGAPAELTGSSTGNGSVYLFTRPQKGVWTDATKFRSKFVESDAVHLDLFGSAVSVGDSGALVVAGSGAGCGNSPGGAYVFARATASWPQGTSTQTAKLTPSDISKDGCFGSGIAIENQDVFVGAYTALSNAGATYSFQKPADNWSDLSLPASMVGGSGSVFFGTSIATGGRSLAIGAPQTNLNGNNAAGAVYIFSN